MHIDEALNVIVVIFHGSSPVAKMLQLVEHAGGLIVAFVAKMIDKHFHEFFHFGSVVLRQFLLKFCRDIEIICRLLLF